MNTIKAHTFQHKYKGVQMFVFHAENEIRAREKFYETVCNAEDWIYLGIKEVI